jgi:hypothetical protein
MLSLDDFMSSLLVFLEKKHYICSINQLNITIMKSNYLFAPVFKKIGWIMFVPFAVLGILYLNGEIPDDLLDCKTFILLGGGVLSKPYFDIFNINNNDWIDEIIIIGLSVSLLFIAFSREKDEDECIANIRMQSFVWAIKANTVLLILGTLLIFDTFYFDFILCYMYTMFFFFIGKYYIALRKFRRSGDEK